jgi:hypothetical protein
MQRKLVLALLAAAALAVPGVARADVVTDWNRTTVDALEAARAPPSPTTSRGRSPSPSTGTRWARSAGSCSGGGAADGRLVQHAEAGGTHLLLHLVRDASPLQQHVHLHGDVLVNRCRLLLLHVFQSRCIGR